MNIPEFLKKSLLSLLIVSLLTSQIPTTAFGISMTTQEKAFTVSESNKTPENTNRSVSDLEETGQRLASNTTEQFDFTERRLNPFIHLTGLLKDSNGEGISDASVMIFDLSENKVAGYSITDSAGNWQFSEAETGIMYRISYYHSHYAFADSKQDVVSGVEGLDLGTVTGTAIEAFSGISTPDSAFTYEVEDVYYARITGYTGTDAVVVIPANLDGYQVRGISYNVFRNNTYLERVALPTGISSIGSSAFSGCVGLQEIELPDGMEGIGQWAFDGCVGLTSVELPDSVQSLGYGAFADCVNLSSANYPLGLKQSGSQVYSGCIKLTSMTVPEGVTDLVDSAFSGCESIKRVSLPGTLKRIGDSAFSNCTGLTDVNLPVGIGFIGRNAFYGCVGLREIELPDGIEEIDNWAFESCIGLTSVELPDSVQSLGYGAFADCVNLSSANYPLGLKESSSEVYSGCIKLTSMTVPEGVTDLVDNAFSGCESIKHVSLPSTLRRIGSYTFSNCAQLRHIELPDGVLSLGNNAFSNNVRLNNLYLPDTISAFGYDVFHNCPNLTVMCNGTSKASIYCIDSSIPLTLLSDEFSFEDSILNRNTTSFVANTSGALANGYVTMNITFDANTSVLGQSGSSNLLVRIPNDMELLERTLKMDEKLLTDYEYRNNQLKIPVVENAGHLSYCLKPRGDSTVATYAILERVVENRNVQEIIGVINERLPILSIQANEVISKPEFSVTGIGPSDSDINIYIDDTYIGTAHTNKSGTYSLRADIPSPENYTSYALSAQAITTDQTEVSASTSVQYNPKAAVIESFVMHYGSKIFDASAIDMGSRAVQFRGNEEMTFDVSFNSPDQVEEVFICSTRSNITKRIEAVQDEVSGRFVAKGFFDPSNKGYLPGKITVQYTTTPEKFSFTDLPDYTDEKYVNTIGSPIKALLKRKTDEYLNLVTNTPTQLSGNLNLLTLNSLLDFDILTDIIPSYLDLENAGEHGYTVREDDYGTKLYIKVAEYAENKVRAKVLDFANKKMVDILIDGGYVNAALGVENVFAFSDALGDALGKVDTLLTWDNKRISLNDMRKEILASSQSPDQKSDALEKLSVAEHANNSVVAAMVLQMALSAAGVSLTFPMSLVLPLLTLQNKSYLDDFFKEFGAIDSSEASGLSLDLKWIIDPAGYVYDAKTSLRLEGVTTTAYHIEYDELDEAFWDRVPGENEYGTIWAASDWNQVNPLITDQEGRYSWDVPQGWWRVKYEKEGYPTVWSHWMTVPPAQTEVNIGM